MQQLNFTDHRRKLNENIYVYAVVSRRSQGLSIGINLNPDKSCNFACPYCQVDRTVPGGNRHINIQQLRQELQHLFSLINTGQLWTVAPFNTAKEKYRRVNDIAFAGDGEPTACPEFCDAVRTVIDERARFQLTEVSLFLLTNATLFHRPLIAGGIADFWSAGGRIWAKLDAGTEEWFRRVDGTKFPFQKVLNNILWAAQKQPIVLQCMFHRFGEERPSDTEIAAWSNRIKWLLQEGGRIFLIQVYTTARKPASDDVLPLTSAELNRIADRARTVLTEQGSDATVSVYG